jgi:hypothetical protein
MNIFNPGCVVCGAPTRPFKHGGLRKRCDKHTHGGVAPKPAHGPGACTHCGAPTRPFHSGKPRLRCDKHAGGHSPDAAKRRAYSKRYVDKHRAELRIKWRERRAALRAAKGAP